VLNPTMALTWMSLSVLPPCSVTLLGCLLPMVVLAQGLQPIEGICATGDDVVNVRSVHPTQQRGGISCNRAVNVLILKRPLATVTISR
jgi:hypothetical protein